MESLVILLNGKPCGELLTEECGLYRRYSAACHMEPNTEPMRLFAVGERGELRLGIMQPDNGRFVLRRQMSAKDASAAGTLLRGELRPLAVPEKDWRSAAEPEKLFRGTVLQKHLSGRKGVLFCRSGECCYLALPFAVNSPFPLAEMFCLAHIQSSGQKQYAVFCFDSQENPRFF